MFVWVYSKKRRFVNAVLEGMRSVTTRVPADMQKAISFVAAAVDWWGFIVPYRIASRIPGVGALAQARAVAASRAVQHDIRFRWRGQTGSIVSPLRFASTTTATI